MSHDDIQQYYDDCVLLVGMWIDPNGNLYVEFVDGQEFISY